MKIKNPVHSIAKATLLLLDYQIKNQYIPDYAIAETGFKTGLTDKELRTIRDMIQTEEYEHLHKPNPNNPK